MVKSIAPALQAHLAGRAAIQPRVAVWFAARDSATGAPAPWGVWNGDDDRTFVIDGSPRTYWGAGALAGVGDLVSEPGYAVRIHRMSLSHLHPDVAAALAATSLRLAPVEWHQIHLAPGTHDLIAAPLRRFRGTVETMTEPTPARGQASVTDLQLASTARDLTRTLALTKSDATLQAVHSGDLFRRWNAVSGKVPVAWGELNGGDDAPPPIFDLLPPNPFAS